MSAPDIGPAVQESVPPSTRGGMLAWLDDDSTFLSALGGIFLVTALAASILFALQDPTPGYRFTARQALGKVEDGQYVEAISQYEQLIPHYPAAEARLGLSYAYLARHDADRAEVEARLAITSASPDWKPAAWAQLGRVLSFQGKSAQAVDAWSTAINQAGSYSAEGPVVAQARSSTWHIAMTWWRESNLPVARDYLQRLQDGDDIYAESARVKLAQLLATTDRDISLKLVQRSEMWLHADRDTGAPSTLSAGDLGAAIPDLSISGLEEGLSIQDISSTLDALTQAMADAESARSKGASEAGIAASWGRSFLAQGEPYLARQQLERAVALQPGIADAHAYLGLALLSTGADSQGIDQLNQASQIDPSRPLPHQALARAYVQQQQWDRAYAELSTLKKLEPDSVTVHLQLADYYVQRRLYDAAEDEYIAAVERQRIDPNAPRDLDAYLALARFYTDVRGLGCDKGLGPAEESLSHHPGDPSSLDAIGWALVQCRKADAALSSLEKAVAQAPGSPRFRFHLGRAYQLLGRDADARAQFNRAIDLDPGGMWERLSISELPNLQPAP